MTETIPTTDTAPAAAEPALKAILAQKIGMTRIYDAHGKSVPVTVLQSGPCPITQILTRAKHGYDAIQVAFGEVRTKSVNRPTAGHFKKCNVPPAKWLREIRTEHASEFQVGQSLKVGSFAAGDFVDVWGVSKGKGFAGAMKRHNFHGGPSTHGQSDRARAPGSSGSNTYPGRVYKGKKFPGHLGASLITVQHLEVVQVMPETDVLLIKGALPGPLKSLVTVRQTSKRVKMRVVHAPEQAKKEKAKKDAGGAKAPAAKAAPAKGAK